MGTAAPLAQVAVWTTTGCQQFPHARTTWLWLAVARTVEPTGPRQSGHGGWPSAVETAGRRSEDGHCESCPGSLTRSTPTFPSKARSSRAGIRYIELRSVWNVNVLDFTDEQVADVRRVLAEHGIRLSSIGSPLGKITIEDDFDAHLARADRAAHVARQAALSSMRPPSETDGHHRVSRMGLVRRLNSRTALAA